MATRRRQQRSAPTPPPSYPPQYPPPSYPSHLTTAEAADYKYRMTIEAKYTSAAELKKNFRFVSIAVAVYHVCAFVFMEAAIEGVHVSVHNNNT